MSFNYRISIFINFILANEIQVGIQTLEDIKNLVNQPLEEKVDPEIIEIRIMIYETKVKIKETSDQNQNH